ncbi:hypothetical protein [Sporosarcina obsidiansis]|uniref:hypothetical protein n=1 Tax=Sporosarcina obsidiansis TaxID=2660748 RepID=UPI00129AD5B7|nr:hypothetical protein [Sporosarcina obsidiansis]
MSTEEIVNLPDPVFVNQCNKMYKVNNELHRSIDLFFYKYGIEQRTERRRHLLSFLEYSRLKQLGDKELVKLGSRRLKEEMEEYLEDSFIVLYMRARAVGSE